ncbi:hypothetical protein E4P40_06010 [Blastococcus sp. CT_GayMR20]|nr:hypothetical protein E4P40_06010 [Blastococcus sp. CT_GayMR20]
MPGAGPAKGLPDPGRDVPSGPRGRACRPPRDRPDVGPNSVAPRDSAPPPSGSKPGGGPRRPEGHPGAPRTGAVPGHPGHSSPQYPRPGSRSKPGPHGLGHTVTVPQPSPAGADDTQVNDAPAGSLPGRAPPTGGLPAAQPTVPGPGAPWGLHHAAR